MTFNLKTETRLQETILKIRQAKDKYINSTRILLNPAEISLFNMEYLS